MRPPRRPPTRLPCPWDSPGKNTGVGCHFLLQCMKVKVKLLSHVRLFATPWTVAYQAPQSTEFSRQEYWSGLPFPSPGDLPNRSIYLCPCCCQAVRRSEQFSTSEMCLKAQTSPVQKVTFSLHLVFQNYWGRGGGRDLASCIACWYEYTSLCDSQGMFRGDGGVMV